MKARGAPVIDKVREARGDAYAERVPCHHSNEQCESLRPKARNFK
jgi:hypothetical protein